MRKTIKNYIEKFKLINEGEKLIVGISGGADSVCLLLILKELQKDWNTTLIGVHINHNLRDEEALRDQKFAEELCEEIKVPCHTISVDVNEEARKRKISLEEAGRDVRREVFAKIAKMEGATKIALAHHKNDNAETLLMNLARGTGLPGLQGIHPQRGIWIRPLLGVSRKEIETYLDEKGQVYCTDSTNLESRYTRNYVRNQVIPLLEESVNSNAVSHMNQTMEELNEIEAYISEQVYKILDDSTYIEESGNHIQIYNKLLCVENRYMQKRVMKFCLDKLADKSRNISRIHVEQLLDLFAKQVGKEISMPYKILAKRTYSGLSLQVGLKHQEVQYDVPLEIPGRVELPNGIVVKASIIQAIEGNRETFVETDYTKFFEYDIIKCNLAIRNRREGDCIQIHGSGNTQSIKKYFINNKVKQEQRDYIPLLVSNSDVLWIVGHRRCEKYRITSAQKRIVKIEIIGGNYGRDN